MKQTRYSRRRLSGGVSVGRYIVRRESMFLVDPASTNLVSVGNGK